MSKHHSHELSEHPEVQWALNLLKPDPMYEPSVLSKYSTEIMLMLSGFAMPSLSNVYNSKPFYTGIQRHIMFVAGGYVLAQFVKKLVDNFQAERDTKLRDYIIRHPELFPEPERIKYSQVLEDWIPIR
ncbi:PREDICTED: NADH dehydrogenase [ubiquinone] 1 subunit C2 [Trachymyrmex septentrionalis]|uniref:NADH dehydrogenase [ubiquinone] 1 subunit C2 n=1 Tax=Trachymyrmex septentrionalis TaxID=34720 RepID=UPI00084F7950|nr:PREDICTED: NADH dehydrogenase [ubiquinone] 1 subunit C2 [Trachymyrmex septentrionalis]